MEVIKMVMEDSQKQLWSSLSALGIVDDTKVDFVVFNALIEDDRDVLQDLLSKCEDTAYVANLTFDELLRLPFEAARKTIDTFSMEKRIDMLQQLDQRRSHYYNETSRYCGVAAAELMTAKEFKIVIGKIKHIEIVQNWLYGIA